MKATSVSTHRQLLAQLVSAINTRHTGHLHRLFSPDFRGQDCAQAREKHGPQDATAALEGYLLAFPDLAMSPKEILLENGRGAVYWTAEGTHLGPWMNIPPTGRRVSVEGMWMIQMEGGLISRCRSLWDVAGLLRALGLLPDL